MLNESARQSGKVSQSVSLSVSNLLNNGSISQLISGKTLISSKSKSDLPLALIPKYTMFVTLTGLDVKIRNEKNSEELKP